MMEKFKQVCGCGDIFEPDSRGSAFIDIFGHCENCEAATPSTTSIGSARELLDKYHAGVEFYTRPTPQQIPLCVEEFIRSHAGLANMLGINRVLIDAHDLREFMSGNVIINGEVFDKMVAAIESEKEDK